MIQDRDCGDENDALPTHRVMSWDKATLDSPVVRTVSRPEYCPRCCEDAEMNAAPDHFAFVCPKGHLIPAIWYVTK